MKSAAEKQNTSCKLRRAQITLSLSIASDYDYSICNFLVLKLIMKQSLNILLQSCLLVWLLQLLFNNLIVDHMADAFTTPDSEVKNRSITDNVINILFSGFSRWDSQHFLHIALKGYTFENNVAFFPLLPIFTRLINRLIVLLFPLVSVSDYFLSILSSVLVVNVAYVITGYILYLLTKEIFDDLQICRLCVLLYSVSPATIFLHSIYSESLYSLFTFAGLYYLIRKKRNVFISAICFAFASLARSNSLMNILFLFYFSFENIFANMLSSCSWVGKVKPLQVTISWKKLFSFILHSAIVLAPIVLYQLYIFATFCLSCPLEAAERPAYLSDYAKQRGYTYKCELDNLQWCRKPIPLSYSAVQSHYWDVGFLRYYQWRKIPCFILTIPVLALVYKSMYCNAQHFAFYVKVKWIFSIHIVCLSIFGLLFFNVEILTRMLFSASPYLYWQAALIMADNFSKVSSRKRMHFYGKFIVDDLCQLWKVSNFRGRLLLLFFLTYNIIGIILHCNFYPWT
ncbi:GPI mannosyltransferase 2 [Trichinella pseudospiralis]|uniref:GPI mannosyltransferase 2 n=1 Tax=Trichinella pseudospiralis TaxID=6337 RepID=A0A0V0YAC9_TRIPS|nr:GPI mannosyltransferase 2 [Trichinella pseudospiralis]